jgi:diguanylate cyclase (GGDEF)-like protein
MIDQLTEIPNRRCFNNRLDVEWSRALRDHTPLSFLLIDVDKFKQYNDTYGHVQGDAALYAVANAVVNALKRRNDFAARWGGEEFVALLPNTPLPGALEVGEQIRAAVEGLLIPNAEGVITKVTISIGIYTQIPEMQSEINGFIIKADAALYQAKESGRNRVCAAP